MIIFYEKDVKSLKMNSKVEKQNFLISYHISNNNIDKRVFEWQFWSSPLYEIYFTSNCRSIHIWFCSIYRSRIVIAT